MSNELRGRPADHALTLAPLAGRLAETGDLAEPYCIIAAAGVVVEAVASYFREWQATSRSPATVRSYWMDPTGARTRGRGPAPGYRPESLDVLFGGGGR